MININLKQKKLHGNMFTAMNAKWKYICCRHVEKKSFVLSHIPGSIKCLDYKDLAPYVFASSAISNSGVVERLHYRDPNALKHFQHPICYTKQLQIYLQFTIYFSFP